METPELDMEGTMWTREIQRRQNLKDLMTSWKSWGGMGGSPWITKLSSLNGWVREIGKSNRVGLEKDLNSWV